MDNTMDEGTWITVSKSKGKSKKERNKTNAHQNAKPLQQAQQQQLPQFQSQAPSQPQQQAQPSVPPPQPPKSNNRSNKSKELNMKGASKEGTDMDAFNDNSAPKTEINANLPPPAGNAFNRTSDTANANSVPVSMAATPIQETENLLNSISHNKKTDSNENVTTIKSEPPAPVVNNSPPISAPAAVALKPATKPFDVTSIVRDNPKSISPPFPFSDNSNEDGERTSNKTEVSSKVSKENDINTIKSSTLPYKPGQWTPDQPNGKKVYEKDFLMALRTCAASLQKPDNILDVVLADDRNRNLADTRIGLSGRPDFTNPPFVNYGGKSSSQRGNTLPKRNSQTGKLGSRSGDKNAKPQPKVSISLRAEVKLHEVENAWKPTRLQKSEQQSEEDKKTAELYRKVRSVLNKLTPQKFDTLLDQFRQLQIDTKERLQGVINLVFDKAIDEPNFSVAYARMCKELQIMNVPIGGSIAEDKKSSSVAFRTLLVTRCQNEFEKQSVDETIRNSKVKEIEECADTEKKKELTFELEEYDRRLRMKSVGTIRFIGELFKQQMLTTTIMMRCLQSLLDNKDDESLECLCKLLTTIGKELEPKGVDLSHIFDEMKKLTDSKRQKISSRIRFMLQDVIELRGSKWVPRRGDTNPKTMDQIQKEAENEHLNIMNTPRKDERSNGSRVGGSRQKVSDDGWSSVSSSRNRQQQFSIQTDKMRVKMPETDAPFGSSQMFGSWGKGSSASKNSQSNFTASHNMYAPLENMETERRPMNSRNKEPYNSKGPSLERNSYKSYEGRGSRSGSQHRETSGPIRTGPPSISSSIPPSVSQPPPKPFTQTKLVATLPAPSVPEISEEKLIKLIHNSLDEYLTDCCSLQTFYQDLSTTITPSSYSKLVCESFNYVLEKNQQSRLKISTLFAYLISSEKLTLDTFSVGLEEFLSYTEDLVIDIPQIWQYTAEQLVRLVTEEVVSFQILHRLLAGLNKSATQKILKYLFALVIKEKGPNFLQAVWQNSGLKLSDFMADEDVASFISDNKLQFLTEGGSPVGQNVLSYEEIQEKLNHLLKSKAEFDDIVNWISANVGERTKETKFIRVLATVIFENSICKNKLVEDVLSGLTRLIMKYIDNKSEYELQCLYSLQALINQREHPQGLLLSICNKLYEESTLSQESFIAWEASQDPAEQGGKGVAVKQLTSFFTQLKEADEDGYSDSDEA